jgi:hypothetical protein
MLPAPCPRAAVKIATADVSFKRARNGVNGSLAAEPRAIRLKTKVRVLPAVSAVKLSSKP